MTIHRAYGKIMIECDACDEILNTHTDDFAEARLVMRQEAWAAEKIGHNWRHYCAVCASKELA